MDPVLVVGAGPSGLTLALDLARRNVAVRLIDKAPAPSPFSRAIGVQPGSLMALGDAFGSDLADELVAMGHRVREIVVRVEDRAPERIELAVEPPYPFILMIAQTLTEEALTRRVVAAGVRCERSTELAALERTHAGADCTIVHEGVSTPGAYAFVAGCDGAHSTVRHALGTSFEGAPYDGDFLLADVDADLAPEGAVHTIVNARGVVAAFPFGGGRFRLLVVRRGAPPEGEPTRDEFTDHVRAICNQSVSFSEFRWLTRFRLHHRLATPWHKGRVALVGDAAHIHSPVGGQGMNTGMQDALVLAPIVQAIVGGAPAHVLAAYEAERVPVARNVVRGTDLIFRQAVGADSAALAFLRRYAVPLLVRSNAVRRRLVRAMSQYDAAARVVAFRREWRAR